MSILIKGMEMPENCGECRFDLGQSGCFCCITQRPVEPIDRPEWCPLGPASLTTDPEVLQARYDQQFADGQRDAYDTIRKMIDLFEELIKIGRSSHER